MDISAVKAIKISKRASRDLVDSIGGIFWNLFLITAGSFICAVAVNGILIPQRFFGAGFTGISLVIHYMIPAIPVSVVYFVLNIPVYALGWMYVGRRFFLYSIPGMLIFSGALEITQFVLPVHDRMLSAILAGIISGTGSGVILKSYGSAGGLDILSVIFMKRFSVRLGITVLVSNVLVLSAGAILFSLEEALYTLIFIYVSAYMLNLVVSGLSQRKAVFVISPLWQEISQGIIDRIGRGVTVLHGQGGYSGRETQVLYTVITFRELARLKQLIRKIDPNAMVVVSETLEVMGQRIGNQPHW